MLYLPNFTRDIFKYLKIHTVYVEFKCNVLCSQSFPFIDTVSGGNTVFQVEKN